VLEPGISEGRPRIESAIDAAEVILSLAPETNGHVAVKAWEALSKFTGRDHKHLAAGKEHEAIRFRDIQASRAKLFPARPGRAWKMSMSATTLAIPMCMR
jgi:nitrate reductase alpha subunit